MRTTPRRRRRQSIFGTLIFILLLSGSAAAGEKVLGQITALHPQNKKMVLLQLRIAEARGKKESLRYYRSIARQQRANVTGPRLFANDLNE
ncbi:MAG: hypothetical protein A2Z40_00800 [Deltaproteobacteria bacterium RBG_19FT_COMBO_60_16]|nr:MAG: hypothetical protein A2Z13_07190 [Deltaproteobacteria bacterium RBG_16_64_85]OGQ00727.1 MAG: hypothetical protein A2Z40_00800 [Deltaproteobacteria bacterium RBG_19FT_COMBO_60_16]